VAIGGAPAPPMGHCRQPVRRDGACPDVDERTRDIEGELSMATPGTGTVPAVDVIPLGGLGEFGMNMLLVVCGESALLVDAGVMFPEPELFGVDLVIPDLAILDRYRGRIAALVLTHGHEDHIGAIAYVIDRVSGPVYGTRFTLALVAPKLEEHGIEAGDRLVSVLPRQTVTAGPFQIEFLRVTHSMPDCVALAIHTPAGVLVHTGDFKIDQTPLDGEAFDLHRFAELGAAGVLALLSDSTNADRRGFTGSERDVVEAFEEIFSSAAGKIVVAAFSTSVYRLQILIDLAEQFGRKVALVGRGMLQTSQIAAGLGRLRLPPGLQIRDVDVRDHLPQDVLCVCTGSQGEPLAALPRIAIDDHRHVRLEPQDVVVFSARVIPGNEKAIARVMNHVARRGAEVIAEGHKHVHVSGHASEEEQKLLISLVKPRFFVPIHGEYRQLARHARMAALVCPETTVLMAEDGDVLRFDTDGGRVAERLPAGRVLIDGTRTGEVADEVLRDRRHLAGDGLVVPVVAINGRTGALEQPPELITRGLAVDARHDEVLRDAPDVLARAIGEATREERTDPGLLKERIRVELQRMFRKRAGRRPLVLPVVMEV
jgi:ribonuclease J